MDLAGPPGSSAHRQPRCPECRGRVWGDTTWHGIAVLCCFECAWREPIIGRRLDPEAILPTRGTPQWRGPGTGTTRAK